MFKRTGSVRTLAGLSAGILIAAGASAYAVTEKRGVGGDNVVHGCINLDTKALRLETKDQPCVTTGPWAERERTITWNRTGEAGARGPAGEDGRPGADGTDGVDGVDGKDGARGAVGPQGEPGLPGLVGLTGAPGPAGAAGEQGPEGPQGEVGAAGPAGPTGERGEPGIAGPAGPTGSEGPTGPAGPSGGVVLRDGNDVIVGRVVTMGSRVITVLTSGNYLVDVGWDGSIAPAQVYYPGAGCTGPAYLNTGGSPKVIYARALVYLKSPNSLAVPDTAAPGGAFGSTSMTAAGIDNPSCAPSSGTKEGWRLTTVQPEAVGLPGDSGDGQLAAPLTFG
jgi:hypothetical protein